MQPMNSQTGAHLWSCSAGCSYTDLSLIQVRETEIHHAGKQTRQMLFGVIEVRVKGWWKITGGLWGESWSVRRACTSHLCLSLPAEAGAHGHLLSG